MSSLLSILNVVAPIGSEQCRGECTCNWHPQCRFSYIFTGPRESPYHCPLRKYYKCQKHSTSKGWVHSCVIYGIHIYISILVKRMALYGASLSFTHGAIKINHVDDIILHLLADYVKAGVQRTNGTCWWVQSSKMRMESSFSLGVNVI